MSDVRAYFVQADDAYADFQAAKAEWSRRVLRPAAASAGGVRALRASAGPGLEQNVVGVGIDEKVVDYLSTGIACLKFLVKKKFAPSELSSKQTIPANVSGLPTDVEEVGALVPYGKARAGAGAKPKPKGKPKAAAVGARPADAAVPNPRNKTRPAQPGCSVGFRDPADGFTMAGTFGLLVQDPSGDRYVLSNNHVLANENQLTAGAPIFQAGLLDGGSVNTDQIAELTRFVKLDTAVPGKVDAAIAKLLKPSLAKPDILFIGAPQGTATAAKDQVVHKFGRTTSYTAGRVTSVNFDVNIPYDIGTVTFEDQIAIRGLNGQRFSDQGDSGSGIVIRATGRVIGLLFGGRLDGTLTFANHISDVLAALGTTLV